MKVRIILADDMEGVHLDIRNTLSSIGFPYEIVKDFYDTGKLLKYLFLNRSDIDEKVDMLILDHDFNGRSKNGLEILEKVRKYAPGLPVLMLTTMEGQEFVKARKEYGIDYIQKPVKKSDLSFRIGSIIEHQEMKNELDDLKKQMKKWKGFASKFKDKDIDLDNPDIMKKVDEFVEGMKSASESKNVADELESCKIGLKKLFGKFPSKVIDYLASAEMFYNKYKEEKGIDFSPIGLNYFKALENALRVVVVVRKLENDDYKKKNKTIGASIIVLRDYITKKYGAKVIRHLYELLDVRNEKIAHAGSQLRYNDLMAARDLMFGYNGKTSVFKCLNEMMAV